MARPHRRALAFLGSGFGGSFDTPRIAAVVDQLALPNRVAPRVDRVDPGRCRGYGAVCGRVRTGWHVRITRQRRVTRGDQGRLIQVNDRGGLSL
jgi:hypothetical protein